MRALLFTRPFLASTARLGNEEIGQAETQSWSCLVWPDTWAHEVIVLRVNVADPLQGYLICQGADLLILFLAEILVSFQISAKKNVLTRYMSEYAKMIPAS